MYFSNGYSTPLPFDLGWMRTVWLQSWSTKWLVKFGVLNLKLFESCKKVGTFVNPSGASNLKFSCDSCKSERLREKFGRLLQVKRWKKRCAVPMRIGILAALHHCATILFGNKCMTTSNLPNCLSRSFCEDCSSSSKLSTWSIGSKQATTGRV